MTREGILISSSPDLHKLHLERKLALAGPEFLTIVVASLSSLSPSYHSLFPPRTLPPLAPSLVLGTQLLGEACTQDKLAFSSL